MSNKILRSICYFTDTPAPDTLERLASLADKLEQSGFTIQTRRICSKEPDMDELGSLIDGTGIPAGIGMLDRQTARGIVKEFCGAKDISFNLDLSEEVLAEDVDLLFKIVETSPEKCFNFAYTFNNVPSSAYFPSAAYHRNGFSIGLQPTNLAAGCGSLDEWLNRIKTVWIEIRDLMKPEQDFLGIDSSIAPLFSGPGSFVAFIKKINGSFAGSVTTDFYLRITNFLKQHNPKPAGLCGIMLPCLEDFELAEEYERGNFTVERNIFLSLHSGLGVDTYPIGIDESPDRILNILKLLQGLAKKHNKPLSARFASDGKARIGEKSDFNNQYLKDVVIRAL